jgi:Xaa-Pro aminopeptidase
MGADMPYREKIDKFMFKERRNALCERLQKEYPKLATQGIVLLFGNFESEQSSFRQESSFYYMTGVREPACALLLEINTGAATLYIPNFGKEREKWFPVDLSIGNEKADIYGLEKIAYLGEPCMGYQCHPFFTMQEYSSLLEVIKKEVAAKRSIFTCNPTSQQGYIEQRFVLERINGIIPGFDEHLIDISPDIAGLRRKKSHAELELLYKALDITMEAHCGVLQKIKAGTIEYELQALIEYVFIALGGSVAFPSIVASGKNSTVLHYQDNNKTINDDELIVIDIGAEYNYYCADLTRTYPVSGRFSKRQREVYSHVLETQEYIAGLAKPGYWLSNKEQPDKSLNHLAQEFLRQSGYGQYFTHGIGHFLGLDVHDVGDYRIPLQHGDVITIEPGIYIPEENLGVRIEDNYWVVEDGVVCLSEELPKQPGDIEEMMKYAREKNDDK